MAITIGLPKPSAKVSTVAPLVVAPGQAFGTIARKQNAMPHGFQKREKPVMASRPSPDCSVDVHVQQELRQDTDHRRPQEHEAHL
jgi:hypothetical protein